MKKIIFALFILLVLVGCKLEQKSLYLSESDVTQIKINGVLSERKSEISGLAWYNDYLIILPQYPDRFPTKDGASASLFAISKAQLDEYFSLENPKEITPLQIPFYTPDFSDITHFEGFEAIAFIDDNIYLAIESSPDKMLGYLVKGIIRKDLSKIEIGNQKTKIEPQTDIHNACYETLFAYDNKLITIYEANGKNVNHNPKAIVFDTNLKKIAEYNFPNIEYRITDATSVSDGKFFAINYFWPGDADSYKPAQDELKEKWGIGKTHSQNENVERIVEFKISDSIILANTPPIYLKLLGNNVARNWEGIVKYENGFILATDKYPATIIAYVSAKTMQ